ncbi:MAG: hypothetical protein HYW89_04340 [Candidatus Sungiibacteriota bacterium]|uniref:Nudix hydrolase domain-containing protein n=1 Tax=Candidatus Sungiibacteriota bacterium TaxID=2750080 RepID=A0A7T5US17_9BACT|nr:MAG: hypothetical protein HYW89_04340 [Candidatus Sungbacteria bacterium]
MELIYTREPFPTHVKKSIFLAGPTPRKRTTPSWRIPGAIKILEELGYDGHVFIPENRDGPREEDINNQEYKHQIAWERIGLNRADLIVFWVPRNLTTMPAFTTNVEFGLWVRSGKIVYGAPPDLPRNKYLELTADRQDVPRFQTLKDTLDFAVSYIGGGAERNGGECDIPLHIWNAKSFQLWYEGLKTAGNILEGAEVLWCSRKNAKGSFVYRWILQARIFIASENRFKTSEFDFALSRTDTSATVLWQEAFNPLNTKIVLVKEFRPSGRTPDGFIHELPSGSSPQWWLTPEEIALEEIKEETGKEFEKCRLVAHGSRQVAGTFSAHHTHLFSIRLKPEEIEYFETNARNRTVFGNIAEGEQTSLEVKTLGEIIETRLLDWSTVGMIMQTILEGR